MIIVLAIWYNYRYKTTQKLDGPNENSNINITFAMVNTISFATKETTNALLPQYKQVF